MSEQRKCPACPNMRHADHYLCPVCWPQLSGTTRRRLWQRDAKAALRLLELNRQIRRDVPLSEIEVTR